MHLKDVSISVNILMTVTSHHLYNIHIIWTMFNLDIKHLDAIKLLIKILLGKGI